MRYVRRTQVCPEVPLTRRPAGRPQRRTRAEGVGETAARSGAAPGGRDGGGHQRGRPSGVALPPAETRHPGRGGGSPHTRHRDRLETTPRSVPAYASLGTARHVIRY